MLLENLTASITDVKIGVKKSEPTFVLSVSFHASAEALDQLIPVAEGYPEPSELLYGADGYPHLPQTAAELRLTDSIDNLSFRIKSTKKEGKKIMEFAGCKMANIRLELRPDRQLHVSCKLVGEPPGKKLVGDFLWELISTEVGLEIWEPQGKLDLAAVAS